MREFEREDIPTLSNYLAARFPYSKDQNLWKERFDMWWFDNPSLTPDTPIGWVLERDDSSIAGFIGSIPVRFRVGERECLAAAGTSWHVEADVRGIYSLQLLSAFHRQQEAALFIQTTPTPPVREILAKFQYSFQPFPSRNVEYFYVISYAQSLKFLMHYFSKESPQAPSLITPMIKRLLRQARENLKIGGKRTPTMARILESSGPDTLVCSECTTCGSDYKEIG
ncbi:MAG TPA: hypothetical protein VE134_09065, partial [Methanomicrobiales archaeon]|nr:hypothetical protein [Methanomicrobiales archaeon]